MQLLEGYFIVTYENLIFEIKGNLHPKDRVIAYLRYIPDKAGNRSSSDGTRFSKIYSLSKREMYLRKKFPQYLWLDKVQGRILQSVSLQDIAIILDPIDALNQIKDIGMHTNELQQSSLELAKVLIKKSEIQWSDIGLTGSQLAGLATPDSDIDLVVYGIEPARKLYSTLKQMLDSLTRIHRYSGDLLDQHVIFRWGRDNQMWELLKSIESKKNLQGLFENKEFFIRLVKKFDEIGYKYGDFTFQDCGLQSVCCDILDDSDSIFTPCKYIVNCKSIPELTEIISYRGRFTEHVNKGMRVNIRGRLESVHIQKTGESFKRFILGENPSDYLIPV